MRSRLRCRLATLGVLYALLTGFLLLYLICFAHVASSRSSADWARSAGMAFLIEELVLELAVAVTVALLGVMRGACKHCSLPIYVIVVIELYRFYRNVIEG